MFINACGVGRLPAARNRPSKMYSPPNTRHKGGYAGSGVEIEDDIDRFRQRKLGQQQCSARVWFAVPLK